MVVEKACEISASSKMTSKLEKYERHYFGTLEPMWTFIEIVEVLGDLQEGKMYTPNYNPLSSALLQLQG